VAAVAVSAGEPINRERSREAIADASFGRDEHLGTCPASRRGKIGAGDLVDVIVASGAGSAHYVAQGLRVLSVATTSGCWRGARWPVHELLRDRGRGQTDGFTSGRRPRLDSDGGTGGQIEIVRSTGEPGTTHQTMRWARLVPLRRPEGREGDSFHRRGCHQGTVERGLQVSRAGHGRVSPVAGDHGIGASFERAATGLDVLVIDDVMRTFSISDLARAQGPWHPRSRSFRSRLGRGRAVLVGLGVTKPWLLLLRRRSCRPIYCGWGPGGVRRRPPAAGPLSRLAPSGAGRRNAEASSTPGPR